MTPTTELFDLIKSLNKSEKGYFKKLSLFHTRGEQNNYVRLFDIIEKQKEYDEAKVLKSFKGEKLINNFSVAKAYLYDLILKSLEAFHTDIDSGLQSLLLRIKILFEKELYTQCLKVITKAEELAGKYEKHTQQLLIFQLKVKLMNEMAYRGFSSEYIDSAFEKAGQAIKKIENETRYSEVTVQLFTRRKKSGFLISQEENQFFESINNGELLKSGTYALSGYALCSFYLCKSLYYFAKGDNRECETYGEKLIKHFEANPNLIKEDLKLYLTSLHNMIVLKTKMKKYHEVSPLADKMRQLSTSSVRIKNYVFYNANNLEITMYLNTGQFKRGLSLVKNIFEDGPGVVQKEQELVMYYNASLVYFGLEDYKMAGNYLNGILNDNTINNFRNDLYCNARIISLFIYLETGKFDLVEYRIKSVQRLLKKWEKLYPLEAEILKFMEKRFKKLYSLDDKDELLKELKNKIHRISKDLNITDNILNDNFFISWLESRIQKKSFSKILMIKAKMLSPGE